MGSVSCVARRFGSLLWRRALSPGAGLSAGWGPRLRLLAAGRLKAGPALGLTCLSPDRARGLHGGPGLEERAEGAAGQKRPETGTAGTGGGRRGPLPAAGSWFSAQEPLSSPVYAFPLEKGKIFFPELEGCPEILAPALRLTRRERN